MKFIFERDLSFNLFAKTKRTSQTNETENMGQILNQSKPMMPHSLPLLNSIFSTKKANNPVGPNGYLLSFHFLFSKKVSNLKNLLNFRQKLKRKRCLKFKVKACTIDNYSRVIFPSIFFTFHIIYWTFYLKIVH